MEAAGALRGLVVLLRADGSARRALSGWPSHVPAGSRDGVMAAAGLARLGARPAEAISAARAALGAYTEAVALAFEVHRVAGTDLASVLERVAVAAEDDADRIGGAQAHAAGARLSARMIALLPVASLPLMPLSGASLTGVWPMTSVACGLCLAFVGLRWMSKLVPEPYDAAGTDWLIADLVSAALRSGMALPAVLDLLAVSPGAPEELGAARRRVLCGWSWGEALRAAADRQLTGLGETIRRAGRSGVPLADQIDLYSDRMRAERRMRSDEEMRAAPVKMAIPLVLCVLPSFILLGLIPHLPTALPSLG